MEDIKQIIERRWKYIQLIYRYFCLEKSLSSILLDIDEGFQVSLNSEEKELLKSSFEKIDDIISFLKENISDKWTWERLPNMHKSILMNGYIEIVFEKRNKAIVINESLKLSKSYLPDYDTNYINAILDKLND